MAQSDRFKYILSALSESEYLNVADIARTLGVSEVTIRKDVQELQQKDLLIRQHGKVMQPIKTQKNYLPFVTRSLAFTEEKECIAKAAAALVEQNDSVILDAGTTTYTIAKHLLHHSPINIATNSISIAEILSTSTHSVSLAGGEVLNQSMCTFGQSASDFFRPIRANKAFIGCTGIRPDLTLTTGTQSEASIKEAMMNSARRVIVVASPDKFTRDQMFGFGSASQIDTIITVRCQIPDETMDCIRKNHIKLMYAGE